MPSPSVCKLRPLVLALWAAIAWGPIGIAQAQPGRRVIELDDLRDLESAFVRLADRTRASAVSIRTYSRGRVIVPGPDGPQQRPMRMPRTHGSGAVIRHDGFILTSTHVIQGADEIVAILHDGREFDARLVRADQRSDLAVLRIDAVGLHPVKLGDLDRVRQGQWCFVVGNPFGLFNDRGATAVTYGIVSALGQDLTGELNVTVTDPADQRYYGNLIQTSAAINPGNSGGPMFNIDGEMIGLVTAIESRSGVSEGVGLAIPISSRTRAIIDQLRLGKSIEYGYLGVEVGTPDRTAAAKAGLRTLRGALVRRANPPDGPAAKARIRSGDIIIEFNGVPIESTDHLVRTVGATPAGQTAKLVYLRNGSRRTAQVTLMPRPVNQVTLGSDDRAPTPRTCLWRGALLQEPTDMQLHVEGLTREDAGLVVVEVRADSDAETAGLKTAQMILAFNRKRVRTIEEFLEADRKARQRVSLRVHAEGGARTLRMPNIEKPN